jgi:cobalt-zinc-cadmium resistance protein CzcA
LARFPGNAYEITQPIQMRFNELIAGVRGDVAIKVFGDDFNSMNGTAEDRRHSAPHPRRGRCEGGADHRPAHARHQGQSRCDGASWRQRTGCSGYRDGHAGRRQAGMIFEGDRRFPVVIRLSEAQRADLAMLGQMQVPAPGGQFVPLSSVADIRVTEGPNQISRENGKRRVVVQANVRGRDVASVVGDAKAAIAKDVRLPAGSYLEWGGQFENLASARERLQLVIPACFALILMLLYGALGSARDAAIVFTGVPMALVGGCWRCSCRAWISPSRRL